nr:hypothetical protein Iba_scaffold41770CG0010 [Ipomoea batatas]
MNATTKPKLKMMPLGVGVEPPLITLSSAEKQTQQVGDSMDVVVWFEQLKRSRELGSRGEGKPADKWWGDIKWEEVEQEESERVKSLDL